MSKRLTRKEIVQEDRIHARLTRISQWALNNRSYLAILAVVLVVVLIGAWSLQGYRESQDAEIQGLFSDALELYHANIGKPEASGHEGHDHGELTAEEEDEEEARARAQELANNKYRFKSEEKRNQKAEEAFQVLAEQYADSQLGILSRYYLGLIARQTKRVDEGKEHLSWVINNADELETRNLARNALAQIVLGENNPEEAATLFEKIIEEPSPNYPPQIILMSLAQSYEKAGNVDKALEHYKKVTSEYPASQQSRDAQSRIDELEDSLELDDSEA